MKLIKDINNLFRFNKTTSISILLREMYKLSQESGNAFLLTRTYQISGVNENTQRKILKLLSDNKLVKRWMYWFKDNKGNNKVWYHYSLSEKLYRVCYELVSKLSNSIRYYNITESSSISDMKWYIKKLYKNTEFILNKEYNIVKHKFRLKWVMFALYGDKQGNHIIDLRSKEVYTLPEFNLLIMKAWQ